MCERQSVDAEQDVTNAKKATFISRSSRMDGRDAEVGMGVPLQAQAKTDGLVE